MAPIDTSKCYHCQKALTVKDRSAWFDMEREDIKGAPMTFTSLYMASKVTGIKAVTSCSTHKIDQQETDG